MKKRIGKIALGIVVALVLILAVGLAYVKLALPNVGPAPEMTIKATAEQIEHGRYLANSVASCIDCHSTRDFSKLTGPLVPGTEGKGGEKFSREFGFPGNYYAPNLTPSHLGSWTDGEIYRAITTGVNRDGRALFPVMPYQNYAQMDPGDIRDIIAYLRTLEPIENEIPPAELDFPINFIINTIPAKREPGHRPDTTDRVAYGKYVMTFAACTICHTPVDGQGNALPGMDMAGGREFPIQTGTVRSMNLTPARSGIGSWTKAAFISRFRSFADKNQPGVHDDEFNTMMPWTMFSQMTDQDLGAIYDYLRTIKPVENKVERFTPKSKLVASR
ncbi:cytochrome c [Spirosoma sp. KNUC1025]|uniref:cytochrome c n=1 Tax=Spirosoma sp. KNUC1025 TaxID=2894082 RepID=UPI0038652BF1|nr:cytochrome c [Spirosoma sp. KNUC1025]